MIPLKVKIDPVDKKLLFIPPFDILVLEIPRQCPVERQEQQSAPCFLNCWLAERRIDFLKEV